MKFFVKISAAATAAVLLCLSAPGLSFSSDAGTGLSHAQARVKAIAGKIESVTGHKARITVVNDPGKEACVLPDGTIVITSALVSSCGSDDEIAFVIAHELSHFIAKDYNSALAPLKAGPGSVAPHYLLSEINADAGAVDFSRKAGYDPAAGERLLGRLLKDAGNAGEGGNSPEVRAALGSRIATLKSYLKTLED